MWACPLSLVQELLYRRREARALAKQGRSLDQDAAAIEAKLWQQQRQPGYPVIAKVATTNKPTDHGISQYITQYPTPVGVSYRGYPIYIE